MPSPAASTLTFRKVLRRFGRNRRGSAAIEFAMVAPVFIALLFAIIESAIMFFASQVLESITATSARMIMTGQAQNNNYQASDFKTYVCNQIPALFTCANIYVDVQSYSAFGNVAFACQVDANGNFVPPTSNYSPGGPGQIVVVSVCYQWPTFVTAMGFNLSNSAGGKRLLIGTAAFQNEPY